MNIQRSVSLVLFGVTLSLAAGAAATAQVRATAPRVTAAPAVSAAVVRPGASASLREMVAPKVRGVVVDETKIRAHVIRPNNVIGVVSDEGRGVVTALKISPALQIARPSPPHLDVEGFGNALHAALKDQTVGYVMQLRKNGQTIYTLQWNWAKTPADGSVGWTPDRQMHIASVSKLITAMAMTKLLDAKSISYDAKIIGYLPTFWTKGPNIDKITFRELMTQTSGFSTGGSSSDYLFMKGRVAQGVPANMVGQYDYENMNFGLCRILIAIINGDVDKDMEVGGMFASLNDAVWDYTTVEAYKNYVQAKVFNPAGVANATLDHPGADAYAYAFPVSSAGGWNSGDLASMAGGAAWHMSTSQLLDVMGTFRRKGTIMSTAAAQAMLDNGFGVDVIQDTPAGKLYNKNGRWQSSGRAEQSLAYFLPQGMELVVLTNSPISNQDTFFRSLVTQIYVDNIKP